MIGHQAELSKLIKNIQKEQPTLLTGDVGIGKSHLLKEVQTLHEKTIYIDSMSPLKPALLETLRVLHENGDLQVKGTETEYLEWEDLRKRLNRLSIKELLEVLQRNVQGYILLLDHLETATPFQGG